MDFWSRLIGGSRSLSNKSVRASSPTERLTTFKRTCNTLQQIWRSSNLPPQETAVYARSCVERLNSVLNDESRGPAPHPCMAYAASSQVFVTVTKLVLMSHDDALIRSAAVFFNTLVDAEVDGVVDNRIFARALVDLVRRTERTTEEVEGRLMELVFGVANNIRLQPDILSAWFAPRADVQENEQQGTTEKLFAGTTRKDDFPLFYLLIDYVHYEGRAGDFARTGLLYLIETASRSKNLERWLIESDLATLMATGLGALYSQLGSLSFGATEGDVPQIVTLSDHADQDTAVRPFLGGPMDSFMSYLLFWQDTIDHCKSTEVNATLLDHFQVLFLEQLLYPSLLESSDVEGGSTAAVLTYLFRILGSIHQADIVHRILHFLLADAKPAKKKTHMSVSRRKSLDVLAAFTEGTAKPSPSLFNLRDLVLLGLQSANRQTMLATLRLLSIVLQRHHYCARSLIRTVPGHVGMQRGVGALNAELQGLLTMATSMVHDPVINESFESYLKDASYILEFRLCSPAMDEDLDDTADVPLELAQDDPIVQELLECLEVFFTNSVIVNLALTEVLMSIASSHLVSLDGWLLVDPSKYKYTQPSSGSKPSSPEPETGSFEQIQLAYQEPSWSRSDTPTLTAAIQRLVKQTQRWKETIPDFDILVAARRDVLHQEGEPMPQPPRSPQLSETPTRSSSQRPQVRTPRPDSEIGSPRGRASRPLDVPDASPSPRPVLGSPLRDPSVLSTISRNSLTSQATSAEELRRRLAMPIQMNSPNASGSAAESQPTNEESQSAVGDAEEDKPHTASLGHVLTNVVILYEFLLELSAMIQVRGSLLGEAGFPGIPDA